MKKLNYSFFEKVKLLTMVKRNISIVLDLMGFASVRRILLFRFLSLTQSYFYFLISAIKAPITNYRFCLFFFSHLLSIPGSRPLSCISTPLCLVLSETTFSLLVPLYHGAISSVVFLHYALTVLVFNVSIWMSIDLVLAKPRIPPIGTFLCYFHSF